MLDLWHDVRLRLRALSRSPGFTSAVVLILGLGIGATSAVVSVIAAVLYHGMPYADPERIVLIQGERRQGGAVETVPVSFLDFRDWSGGSAAFESMAVWSDPQPFNLSVEGEAQHVEGELVSAGYFRLLGVRPALGRLLPPDPEASDETRAVVVGDGLWRSAFGADPSLPGRRILLNGESYEVLGVLPPGVRGMSDSAQLFLPLALARSVFAPPFLELRRYRWLQAAGRLAPGVDAAAAQAALGAVSEHLAAEYPDSNRGVGVHIVPLRRAWFGELARGLATLLGGALLVLLIACTNVANLLLGRALARRREVSVRAALGASRPRLAGELLLESVLLALLGCAAGLLLAGWATGALVAASGAELRSFVRIGLDPAVVASATLLAALSGLAFGLAPAAFASRADLAEVLRERGRSGGAGRHRFQSALVVGEIALALALLIGAGLMVKGFSRLRHADLGFRPANLLTLRVYLKGERYADDASVVALSRTLLERLRAVPGVGRVALAGPGLPTDDWYGADFALEQPGDAGEENRHLFFLHHVSPGFFATLGVPIVEGRDFGPGDTAETAPVVVVSRELARRYFPGGEAVGRGLRFFRDPPDTPWLRVVGVVGDVRQRGLARSEVEAPDLYLPLFQRPPRVPPILGFVVRPSGSLPASSLVPALRRELAAIAPGLPPYDLLTMDQRLDRQASQARFLVLVMSLFSLAALLLAAIGIYGVVSYSVTQITHELALRLALGAERGQVLCLVVGRAAALAGAGILLGLVAALFLARALGNALHGVSAADPLTFVATAAALFVVALGASAVPVLRVMRVDPMEVLRAE